jgi:hypothetical protein
MIGLWREKKDGRRAPGYLFYLLGGTAAVAVIWFLHRRLGEPPPPANRRSRPGAAAEVGSITRSAALMAPVKPADPSIAAGARSYRLPSAGGSTAAAISAPGDRSAPDSFNAISAALAGQGGTDTGADASGGEGVGARFAALPPAFPPDPIRSARAATPAPEPPTQPPKLVEYRDPDADSGRPAARPRAAEPRAVTTVPRGTLIAVYLLTTVDTSNPAAVLQFGVADDLVWGHRCQLPFGTRLLGKVTGRPMRDRLNLVADTVLYPDGLELPINASAVEADETGADIRPGLAAVYCPPPRWAQIAPYVAEAVTGFMGLLQSRAQQQLAVGVGGVSVQTSMPDDARAPLLQAAGQGVQDFAASRLKEVEQRYASYYLIPAGTACWLQLDADLDLSAAHGAEAAPDRRRLPLSRESSFRASETISAP